MKLTTATLLSVVAIALAWWYNRQTQQKLSVIQMIAAQHPVTRIGGVDVLDPSVLPSTPTVPVTGQLVDPPTPAPLSSRTIGNFYDPTTGQPIVPPIAFIDNCDIGPC